MKDFGEQRRLTSLSDGAAVDGGSFGCGVVAAAAAAACGGDDDDEPDGTCDWGGADDAAGYLNGTSCGCRKVDWRRRKTRRFVLQLPLFWNINKIKNI